jgi:hypothetical protein
MGFGRRRMATARSHNGYDGQNGVATRHGFGEFRRPETNSGFPMLPHREASLQDKIRRASTFSCLRLPEEDLSPFYAPARNVMKNPWSI